MGQFVTVYWIELTTFEILATERLRLMGFDTEVEFVHPVSAGGSVKFLPAV